MMTRVVNALLILAGTYVILVYALWSPYPLFGLDMFILPINAAQPNNFIVGAVTIAVGVVALLAGLFSLLRRSARREASLMLALVGAYLLALRLIYPPVISYPGAPANYAYVSPSEPTVAWMCLVVGVVAAFVGGAGFVVGGVRRAS